MSFETHFDTLAERFNNLCSSVRFSATPLQPATGREGYTLHFQNYPSSKRNVLDYFQFKGFCAVATMCTCYSDKFNKTYLQAVIAFV